MGQRRAHSENQKIVWIKWCENKESKACGVITKATREKKDSSHAYEKKETGNQCSKVPFSQTIKMANLTQRKCKEEKKK